MNEPTVQFLIGIGVMFALGLGLNALAGYRLHKLGKD